MSSTVATTNVEDADNVTFFFRCAQRLWLASVILMLGLDCLSSQKPVEVGGLRTASSRAKVPKEA